NFSSEPSEIHDFFVSRLKLDIAYPSSGTPTSAAAIPFIIAPIFSMRLRRDTGFVGEAPAGAHLQPHSGLISLMANLFLSCSSWAVFDGAWQSTPPHSTRLLLPAGWCANRACQGRYGPRSP